MENDEHLQSTQGVRQRNTVRITLLKDAPPEAKIRFGSLFIISSVLENLFKMSPQKISCVQDFARTSGFFDVSFFELRVCNKFVWDWEQQREHHLLKGLRLKPLYSQEFVPLTIHMYNPWVPDEDVKAWLVRQVAAVKGGTRLTVHGYWSGKRRYAVLLKKDQQKPGCFIHPPGSFSIGPHRGFLFYPGQPMYCRRCGGEGHTKDQCQGTRCRYCLLEGHAAADCSAPRTCSLCGSGDHLYRDCLQRCRSYAERARRAEQEEVELADRLEREEEARAAELSDSQLLAVANAGEVGEEQPALGVDLLGETELPLLDVTELDKPPGVITDVGLTVPDEETQDGMTWAALAAPHFQDPDAGLLKPLKPGVPAEGPRVAASVTDEEMPDSPRSCKRPASQCEGDGESTAKLTVKGAAASPVRREVALCEQQGDVCASPAGAVQAAVPASAEGTTDLAALEDRVEPDVKGCPEEGATATTGGQCVLVQVGGGGDLLGALSQEQVPAREPEAGGVRCEVAAEVESQEGAPQRRMRSVSGLATANRYGPLQDLDGSEGVAMLAPPLGPQVGHGRGQGRGGGRGKS